MWDDAKLGFEHTAGWERLALVSDVGWVRVALEIFGLAIPGRVRVFHDQELAAAIRWVSE